MSRLLITQDDRNNIQAIRDCSLRTAGIAQIGVVAEDVEKLTPDLIVRDNKEERKRSVRSSERNRYDVAACSLSVGCFEDALNRFV